MAATAMDSGREEIVGLADVAHLDTGLAELGVVVAEARQNAGVGKLLTEVMASLAAHHGAPSTCAPSCSRAIGRCWR